MNTAVEILSGFKIYFSKFALFILGFLFFSHQPHAEADFDDLPVPVPVTTPPPVAPSLPTPSQDMNTATESVPTPANNSSGAANGGASSSGSGGGLTGGGAGKTKENRQSTDNLTKTSSPKPGTSKTGAQTKSNPQKSPASGGIEHNSAAPVNYSAQSLEGSMLNGRILLKGDVQIKQADAVMKSDVAELFSNRGTTTPQRAIAKGRVTLNKAATATSQELKALAAELEYFIPARKVILKGKPKIWRGTEWLQGEVIEVFLDTNEIKVQGARGIMEPNASTPAASPATSGNSSSTGIQNGVNKKSQSGQTGQSGRR